MVNKITIAWLMLIMGGVFQIGWSIGLDYTDSFTNILWDAITIVFLFFSMVCLSKPISMGINFTTAYAVWIGIGVILTIVVSALLGLETVSIGMVICMGLIIGGVIGLKMTPVEYRNKNTE